MTISKADIARITSFVDLTTLSGSESQADLRRLIEKQFVGETSVAAICVYPQFIPMTRALMDHPLPMAAVANFPGGSANLIEGERSVATCTYFGADEIDYVLPYRAAIAGEWSRVETALRRIKPLCGDAHLKVILETGVLKQPNLIERASRLAIDCGADVIKTSTGKVKVNATLEAAEIMLTAIKDSGKDVGFKPAGGIKTADQAMAYIDLSNRILGDGWARPERFRIGASSIIDDLRARL